METTKLSACLSAGLTAVLATGLIAVACAPAKPTQTAKPDQKRLAVEPDNFETWFRLRKSNRSTGAMGANRNMARLLDEQEPIFLAVCHKEINRPDAGCQIGSDQLLVLAAVLSDGRLVEMRAFDKAPSPTTLQPMTSRRLPGLIPYLSLLRWHGGSAEGDRLGRASIKTVVHRSNPKGGFQLLALGACPANLLATRPLSTGGPARQNLESLAPQIGRESRLVDAAWVQVDLAGSPAQLGLAEELRYAQAEVEEDEEGEGLGIAEGSSAGSCRRTYTIGLARPGHAVQVLTMVIDDTLGE